MTKTQLRNALTAIKLAIDQLIAENKPITELAIRRYAYQFGIRITCKAHILKVLPIIDIDALNKLINNQEESNG